MQSTTNGSQMGIHVLGDDNLELILHHCLNDKIRHRVAGDIFIESQIKQLEKIRNNWQVFANPRFLAGASQLIIHGGEMKQFSKLVYGATTKAKGQELVATLCEIFEILTIKGWDKQCRKALWDLMVSRIRQSPLEMGTELRLVNKQNVHTNCGSTVSRIAGAKNLQSKHSLLSVTVDKNATEISEHHWKECTNHLTNVIKRTAMEMLKLADPTTLPKCCKTEILANLWVCKKVSLQFQKQCIDKCYTQDFGVSLLCCVQATTDKPRSDSTCGFGIGYSYRGGQNRGGVIRDVMECNERNYNVTTRWAFENKQAAVRSRKRKLSVVGI